METVKHTIFIFLPSFDFDWDRCKSPTPPPRDGRTVGSAPTNCPLRAAEPPASRSRTTAHATSAAADSGSTTARPFLPPRGPAGDAASSSSPCVGGVGERRIRSLRSMRIVESPREPLGFAVEKREVKKASRGVTPWHDERRNAIRGQGNEESHFFGSNRNGADSCDEVGPTHPHTGGFESLLGFRGEKTQKKKLGFGSEERRRRDGTVVTSSVKGAGGGATSAWAGSGRQVGGAFAFFLSAPCMRQRRVFR